MSPTPERAIDLVKLFAPLILGIAFLVWGIVREDASVIAIGAGLLGIPGLTGTLTAHRATTDKPAEKPKEGVPVDKPTTSGTTDQP